MGTYTPNYKFLKIGDGSVDSDDNDYVDVISQIDRNLQIVDNVGKRVTSYKFLDTTLPSAYPLTGNVAGDKLFSNYTQAAYVWSGTAWNKTDSKKATPQDLVLSAGLQAYTTGPAPDYTPRYILEYDTVYLQGIISKTAMGVWTQGATVAVLAANSLPKPAKVFRGMIIGGSSTSRAGQFYYWVVGTDGSLTIAKYGPNAQTAGNSENYVSLESIHYAVS